MGLWSWSWTRSTAKGVWLTVLLDVTLADPTRLLGARWSTNPDAIWDDDMITVPDGFMAWATVAGGLVAAVALFLLVCVYVKWCRELRAEESLVTTPMAPATLGPAVRSYTQPPVPRRLTAPVAPYPPQQQYYQQAYPQEALYVGHNMAPFAEPPTAATSSPTAPVQPPPYSYAQQRGQ